MLSPRGEMMIVIPSLPGDIINCNRSPARCPATLASPAMKTQADVTDFHDITFAQLDRFANPDAVVKRASVILAVFQHESPAIGDDRGMECFWRRRFWYVAHRAEFEASADCLHTFVSR